MKKHLIMKTLKSNDIKTDKKRFTVCLDSDIADLLYTKAKAEDRKPAALLAIFAKRELNGS